MTCAIDYGSICSGIEAASLAWECLDFKPRWFAEIEPFPSAVLAYRWPKVPNLGDMTKLCREVLLGIIAAPLILVGGTPCQAFSVAGMRAGLADPRGALTIKFVELADAVDHVRPAGDECIVVWENVPGVLSDKGNAFGCFLGALVGESDALLPSGGRWTNAGCVYGPKRAAAWRVLDAQYFGVAQRRRRVFVVASARADFDPAAVLLESESMRRDHPPRRSQGENPTGTIAGGARRDGGYSHDDIPLTAATVTSSYGKNGGIPAGNDCLPTNLIAGTLQAGGKAAGSATLQDAEQGLLVAFGGGANCQQTDVSTALSAHPGGMRMDAETETFVVHGTQDPCVELDQAHTLGRNNVQENAVLAFSCKDYGADAGELSPTLRAMGHGESHANAGGQVAVVAPTLRAGNQRNNSNPVTEADMLVAVSGVRRLTPRECERLQGMPDDHTLIPWRGKTAEECPDGPRYKAIGNSKAVPVVRWIGRRIKQQLDRRA
jgi:DNA (cytosine-5)-methyltransferase 1